MITNKDSAYTVIRNALKLGYRYVETAPIYINEEAITDSSNNRHDIIITSKIPPHIKTYKRPLSVVERLK
ncbi:MAG: aldo/keto reductase [Bacillota bacterium]